MKKEESAFYVCIDDPISMRRDFLLSSKNILDTLKTFESASEVRSEKLSLFHELKDVCNDILKLDRKLRSLLPKTKISANIFKAEKAPLKKIVKKPAKKSVLKAKLDVLEDELSRVESRLRSLK